MALPFPDIPPSIVTLPAIHLGSVLLGPFSIRWVRPWLYRRHPAGMALRGEPHSHAPAVGTGWRARDRAADRRHDPVDHHRRHRRGPDRLHPVLHAAAGKRARGARGRPGGDHPAVAWRHELPRRLDRGHHRPDPVHPAAADRFLKPDRSRGALRADRVRACEGGEFRQRRIVGPGYDLAARHGVLRSASRDQCRRQLRGGTAAALPQPAVRGDARRTGPLLHSSGRHAPSGVVAPPRRGDRTVPAGLRPGADDARERADARRGVPRPALWPDHGDDPVGADDLGAACSCCGAPSGDRPSPSRRREPAGASDPRHPGGRPDDRGGLYDPLPARSAGRLLRHAARARRRRRFRHRAPGLADVRRNPRRVGPTKYGRGWGRPNDFD